THGGDVRRRVGFVFTDPLAQLVMPTPIEDVALSLRRTLPRAERRDRAAQLLDAYGLAHVQHSSVYDLSGGERQLVALVSVLAVEPAVVVADEPTTLLDLSNRNRIRDELARLDQQLIVATHDLELAQDAERVLVVDGGRIVADGPPELAIGAYVELVGR
ncbi:MAG TPA: ABC transporter ATP-binding protein, partial [Cellulomonadaceae bacterium]|nr:ABC transporter ATP-binding protein [Cellulomonadaceae bacterium]